VPNNISEQQNEDNCPDHFHRKLVALKQKEERSNVGFYLSEEIELSK